MTRAALTKLLILVILAFIICLPEFFTLYRVSKVNFLCLPYQPCKQANQVKMEGNGRPGIADKRKDICDPSLTSYQKEWKQICTQEQKSSSRDSAPETGNGGDDPKMSWFMCDADIDMEELNNGVSSSALYLEVSVKLQLNHAETLNLTLYGRSNHSSLYLRLPEEEEGEAGDDESQKEAFCCCFSPLPTSESTNQSQCLLWFANQTVLTETAKEKLPWKRTQKDEWRCMFRVIWLALMCMVLLTVAAAVIREICRDKCLSKKFKIHQSDCNFTNQQIEDSGKQMDISTPKGTALQSYGFQSWSRLSPIQEAVSREDIETLLDGNTDHSYTANLHHRSHPPLSQKNMPGDGGAPEGAHAWC